MSTVFNFSKTTQRRRAPVDLNQDPPGRFQVWYLNLMGPLSNSGNCRYTLACMKRFTRWVKAIPVSDATAATCNEDFMANIIARFGVPFQIMCDGPAFTAQLFEDLCFQLGIHLTHSTLCSMLSML